MCSEHAWELPTFSTSKRSIFAGAGAGAEAGVGPAGTAAEGQAADEEGESGGLATSCWCTVFAFFLQGDEVKALPTHTHYPLKWRSLS